MPKWKVALKNSKLLITSARTAAPHKTPTNSTATSQSHGTHASVGIKVAEHNSQQEGRGLLIIK
jgi:hypothetical protein